MTENGPSQEIANQAQSEFWNSASGQIWWREADKIDGQMAALTEALLQRAAPKAGEAVLDVGCGTGQSSRLLAQAVGQKGRVLGADISSVMLSLAKDRAEVAGLTQAQFEVADAQVHAFEAQAFDLLFSRFGVMFFEDPVAAFTNLRQALRPGARLAFVCWGPLAEVPWFRIPREVAARHLGPGEPQDPKAPGPMAFSDPGYPTEILESAGFESVAIDSPMIELHCPGDPRAEAEFAVNLGPARRFLLTKNASEEQAAAITRDIEQAFVPFAVPEGGLRVPCRMHFVTARNSG